MRTLRTTLAILLVASAAAALAGCGCGREVAATVNGEKIYVDEIDAEIEGMKTDYPEMFQGVDGDARELDFRRRILDNFVVAELVRQAAKDMDIDVTDDDVDEAMADIKANFPDEAAYQAQLEAVDTTEEELRQQTYDALLNEALLEVIVAEEPEITEEEIEAYYEENEESFEQEAAKRAAHILFAAEDKETAEDVLDRIRGGASFAQMAQQYSIDPATKERDGDLGWPSTPYVAEFQEALDELEVGEVSDLVETVFGWHIITVLEDREATTKTLEEASDEIVLLLERQKQSEAYQRFIDALRAEAEIEYFVDYAPASSPASEEATQDS